MPLSFQSLAEHSADSVQALAVAKEIEIVIENPSDMEFPGDADRLEQVIINLLGNAIKFSPNQSKVVIKGEEKDRFVEIRVIDSGPGIPADYKKKVFERFQQALARRWQRKGRNWLRSGDFPCNCRSSWWDNWR